MSWLSDIAGTSRPSAPTLPAAPTLQTPQLPAYPGMSPEQVQLLQQQQGYLQQLQKLIGGYGGGAYGQQNNAVAGQELTNYQNALTGNIPPNQAIAQQKARDWAQTMEQAGQQGIRLSGDTPERAVSQSTAGNQIIQDFNKRYGMLEQQYNLGQQQFGQQANMQRLGMNLGQFGAQVGAYGQMGDQAAQLYQPYQQQQLGPWSVQTQQALSNSDIANQNAMNQYNRQMQQIGLNYNNSLAGYQNSMGMLSGALQLGGTAIGAGIAGPMGAYVGNSLGQSAGNMVTGGSGGNGSGMGFNPGSFINPYQRPSPGYSQVPSSAVNYPTGGTAPSNYYLYNGGR